MKEKFIIEKNWLDPHIIESDEPFEMRYPHAIQIELMDICNLHCTHCYLETEEYKKNRIKASFLGSGYNKYSIIKKLMYDKDV